MPVPVAWSRGDGHRRTLTPGDGWTVSALGDQHAFVRLPDAAALRPGDLVGLGISHPCTTFDKWARFWLVDDDGVVTGVVNTEFD
jgi:D-serine dehydratase